jgi:hypothetical protein
MFEDKVSILKEVAMKNLVLLMCLFMVQSVKAEPAKVVEVTSTVKGAVLELEVSFDLEPKKDDAKVVAVTLAQMLYKIGVAENETLNLSKTKVTSFVLKDKKATLKVSGVPKMKLPVTGFKAEDVEKGEKTYVLTFSAAPNQEVLAGALEFISTWETQSGYAQKVKIYDLTQVKKEPLKLIYKVKWQ